MDSTFQPHPLDPLQRLQLALGRGLMVPLRLPPKLRASRSISITETRRYGERRDETLQIIHPHAQAPVRPPVAYIHGGGWILGRKELYTADLDFLAERGHRIFNFDYPLAPEHPFPVPLISLLRGLALLRRDHGVREVHVMGDSAGGNLALMAGLMLEHPRLRANLGPGLEALELPEVRSVISLYGVLDRLSWLEHGFPGARLMLHCYGGRGAFEPRVGPDLALTPLDLDFDHCPRCLIAAGTRDPLMPSSKLAFEELEQRGARVRMEIYEGEQHGFFNMSWRDASQRLRTDIVDFLDET
jgi:acetyl esterase